MNEIKKALLDALDDVAIDAIKTLEAPAKKALTNVQLSETASPLLKVGAGIALAMLPVAISEIIKLVDKIDGEIEVIK